MRKIAGILWLPLALGLPLPGALSDEQDATKKRDYDTCLTQIEDYVKEHFQQTVTGVDFDFVFDYMGGGAGGGLTSGAVAYVKECPGYHVFDLFATDFDCDARAHVGKVPNYIRYRVTEGGC